MEERNVKKKKDYKKDTFRKLRSALTKKIFPALKRRSTGLHHNLKRVRNKQGNVKSMNRQIVLLENVQKPQLFFSLKHLRVEYYFTACQARDKAERLKLYPVTNC